MSMASDIERIFWNFLHGLAWGLWAKLNGFFICIASLHKFLDDLCISRLPPPKLAAGDVPENEVSDNSSVPPLLSVNVRPEESKNAQQAKSGKGAARKIEIWAGEVPYNCNIGLPPRRRKWYAVAFGRHTGIFEDWLSAKVLVEGYDGAMQRSFFNPFAAELWMGNERPLIVAVTEQHLVNLQFLGIDMYGHAVYSCKCCYEVFCLNKIGH